MDVGGLLYRFATEGWPAKMAGGIVDAVKLPGQVAGGLLETKPAKPGVWSDEDEARSQLTQQGIYDRATDLAGLVMGGGYGAAQPGAVGIFGGRLAKTADQAALSRAEDMAAKGASREQIWNDTGWFQGADKKWRFEIDDSGGKIGANAMSELTAGGDHGAVQRTIAGTLHHKDLYNAYPDLRQIDADVRYNAALPNNAKGGVLLDGVQNGGRPQVKVSTNAMEGEWSPRSVLLHELQHGVQAAEGFAGGGNLASKADQTRALYQQRKSSMTLEPDVFKQINPGGSYQSYLKQVDKEAKDYAAKETYRRLSGEVEARNVQSRMDMTMDQRRASPPWATQDVPDDMQILQRVLGKP